MSFDQLCFDYNLQQHYVFDKNKQTKKLIIPQHEIQKVKKCKYCNETEKNCLFYHSKKCSMCLVANCSRSYIMCFICRNDICTSCQIDVLNNESNDEKKMCIYHIIPGINYIKKTKEIITECIFPEYYCEYGIIEIILQYHFNDKKTEEKKYKDPINKLKRQKITDNLTTWIL